MLQQALREKSATFLEGWRRLCSRMTSDNQAEEAA